MIPSPWRCEWRKGEDIEEQAEPIESRWPTMGAARICRVRRPQRPRAGPLGVRRPLG